MIRDVLPALIAAGARIAAYKTTEYLRDVGQQPATGSPNAILLPVELRR